MRILTPCPDNPDGELAGNGKRETNSTLAQDDVSRFPFPVSRSNMRVTMLVDSQPQRPSDAEEPWHARSAAESLRHLDSSDSGLSAAEVARRIERFGENRLKVSAPQSVWSILVDQLRSVVVLLLIVAAGVAWAIGDPVDAAAIGVVLLINVAIGFVTELRARRAMEALRSLEVPRATVRRDGKRETISARELVPGDVIELEAGQSVPADARLLRSAELRVEEAPLTGESVPTDKHADDAVDADAPIAERSTMVYQATSVVAGSAAAVVVATGNSTEVGRIGVLTSGLGEERTPLEQRLDSLGRRLVVLAIAVAGAVGALGLLRGEPIAFVAQTALALAIAAVPEGLPAVATITLALGVWRMARREAIVRRLPAVETLGSATVICADKTGTLTAGRMRVSVIATADDLVDVEIGDGEASFTAAGEPRDAGQSPIAEALRVAALANRAELLDDTGDQRAAAPDDSEVREEESNGAPRVTGDPTEVALLVLARAAGLDRARELERTPEVRAIPFSSERQWMATVHDEEGGEAALIKGAPDRLIAHASHELSASGERPLNDKTRERWAERNRELASEGLRVLAVGRAPGSHVRDESLEALTLIALIGMADPPADGVLETVERLHTAGIRTIMITGDQQLTALSVARHLGIASDAQAIDGRELASLDAEELASRLTNVSVFNRVSPVDKLRIVEALQKRSEIVAMLGDGVNDAAALKKADIGVAMGQRGTDIAKDAADVVLADDRFATIGAAVEEGRVIYDNIRKFVFYLFSCNVAEVLVLLVAGIVGLPQPLMPLQILWLNVITDTFPALSLAVEPAEEGTMARPPRDPDESMLSRVFLGWIGGYAVLITAATLTAYLVTLHGESAERARTVAFMTLALAQAAHLVNAQSSSMAVEPRRLGANRWAIGALALVIVLQGLALYVPPLASVLQVTPLSLAEWGIVVPCALAPALGGLLLGVVRRRRR
jgi:Ca2+-transporting ATPase